MEKTTSKAVAATPFSRYVMIGAIVIVAFFASYRFAVARSRPSSTSSGVYAAGVAPGSGATGAGVAAGTSAGAAGSQGTAGAGGVACACCGGASGSSTPVQGTAKADGSVQKITVDASSGSYNPNVINLKAGVPAEITFGQATGCLGQVQSQALGFYEDLTSGPKTVKLPALKAGTYEFSCGMQMVFGSIVVK